MIDSTKYFKCHPKQNRPATQGRAVFDFPIVVYAYNGPKFAQAR